MPAPIPVCDINGTSPYETIVFGIDYSSESFSIDQTTGAVTTTTTFDYESGDQSFMVREGEKKRVLLFEIVTQTT